MFGLAKLANINKIPSMTGTVGGRDFAYNLVKEHKPNSKAFVGISARSEQRNAKREQRSKTLMDGIHARSEQRSKELMDGIHARSEQRSKELMDGINAKYKRHNLDAPATFAQKREAIIQKFRDDGMSEMDINDVINKKAEASTMNTGWEKVANTQRKMHEATQRFLDRAENAPHLGAGEQESLLQNLRTNYGMKADFQQSATRDSRYFNPKATNYLGEHPDGLVMAGPNKEVILHEVGHATDPKFDYDANLATTLGKAAPAVGFLGGVTAPAVVTGIKPDDEGINGGALAGAGAAVGAGSGLGYMAGKKIEGTEDRANQFVKKYLTDEMGDASKAQSAFDNSPLPHGRETYKLQTRGITKANAGIAAVGGAMGLGLAGLVGKIQEKNK